MSIVRARYRNRRGGFIANQRGAVAFEVPFVFGFLIIFFLFPLADVAIAGFKLISAKQALRAFGQLIQYSPPPDVTNTSSWASAAITKANAADPRFPISNLQVKCGAVVCNSGNATEPVKYYSFTTTITITPIVLPASVLCPGGDCTPTLSYSERFQ